MRIICFSLPVAFTLFAANANGDSPDWWHEGDSPVVSPMPSSVDHRAVANLGQLKAMALAAKLRMDEDFASAFGAGREINQLIETWFADPHLSQPLASDANYAPANLGQLKAVSSLFYNRLALIEGAGAPTPPWTATTADDANYAPANLGQLKNVFYFDLQPKEIEKIDSDGDGLDDWWELFCFGNLTTVGAANLLSDADGDGLTLGEEEALGTNPNAGIQSVDSATLGVMIFMPN